MANNKRFDTAGSGHCNRLACQSQAQNVASGHPWLEACCIRGGLFMQFLNTLAPAPSPTSTPERSNLEVWSLWETTGRLAAAELGPGNFTEESAECCNTT
jgi:hypothetical protein